ncbi:hypothetical protein [Bdellovibrio sp. HCB337]|uniref:hypothetical protein n=1 Tax=Bdellovibrio sp. HCB337 TaxID=3394358 RepID=UPI0039A71AF1
MKTFMKVFILISVFFGSSAWALEYSAGVQHAGFLGTNVIYAGVENNDKDLGLDLLLGRSKDSDDSNVDQVSLKFRYLPWVVNFANTWSWRPIYGGLFLTYSPGKEFFYDSPDKYPQKNYYDATFRRYGALVGSVLSYMKISIYGELAILDKTLESQVVSNAALSWQDSVSAAVGLRWNF